MEVAPPIVFDVPEEFYCPISGELMVDPVSEPMHKGGHTYERCNIIKWLETKQTSPMTNNDLTIDELVSNDFAKRSIDSIRGSIKKEQLKIDSKIFLENSKKYIDKLDEITINNYYHDKKLYVNINTPDIDVRPPSDIVLCIDISGSMGTEAIMKGESGEKISHGLSILSIVKTAAKSVLYSLNDNDNISIVTYSSTSKTIVENSSCSESNKSIISIQIDELKPLDTTNIWDGLNRSLDILRTSSPSEKNKGIFLLTDGQPNIVPPRGHESMLNRYFDQHNFRCPISCYGFGYALDSELLYNVSDISGGDGFSFIPDSTLVGTTFIHGISNFLINAYYSSQLNIKLKKGVKFYDNSSEKNININSIKYGKSKDILLCLKDEPTDSDFIEVSLLMNDKCISNNIINDTNMNHINCENFRIKFIDTINECITLHKNGDKSTVRDNINSLCTELSYQMSGNTFLEDLYYDLNGQIKEAFNFSDLGNTNDYFSRWGKYYLTSIMNAYLNQICNNFKDKGVQHFNSLSFDSIRDHVDNIFNDLPAPVPDIKYHSRYSTNVVRSAPPMTMNTYNSSSNPCCSENSLIKLHDNTFKYVDNIKKNDKVLTIDNNGNISISEIECVIKSKCDNNMALLVDIDGLKLTPYHPIINNSKWIHPISIGFSNIYKCNFVYSFITKNRNSIILKSNNSEFTFATFGHNYKGDIIEHPYYGTDKVINDMKKFISYDQGYVLINKYMINKDKDTNLVNNIKL